ncbi:hypothetical protein COCVIDRAFT_19535 [Bipolaris victoriae FI3]|uniref:Uncharacterized protein n=1 Tax=Bipolaris victoriae (strain FI3) TaxID=930091 RepID=W7E3P1_BIPV3|nr:hypothetical protein COCVIDRAFT_19535 [Bipolaris victoriae FI3]
MSQGGVDRDKGARFSAPLNKPGGPAPRIFARSQAAASGSDYCCEKTTTTTAGGGGAASARGSEADGGGRNTRYDEVQELYRAVGCSLLAPPPPTPAQQRPSASGQRCSQPTHPKTPPAPALVPNAILFISRRQAKGELALLARPHLETMLLLGLLTVMRPVGRGPGRYQCVSGPTDSRAGAERSRGGGEACLCLCLCLSACLAG